MEVFSSGRGGIKSDTCVISGSVSLPPATVLLPLAAKRSAAAFSPAWESASGQAGHRSVSVGIDEHEIAAAVDLRQRDLRATRPTRRAARRVVLWLRKCCPRFSAR